MRQRGTTDFDYAPSALCCAWGRREVVRSRVTEQTVTALGTYLPEPPKLLRASPPGHLSSPSSPTEPQSRSGAPIASRFHPTYLTDGLGFDLIFAIALSIPLLLLLYQKRRPRSQLIPDVLAESPCLGLYSSSLVSSTRRSYSYVVFRLTNRPDLALFTLSLPALLRPFFPFITHSLASALATRHPVSPPCPRPSRRRRRRRGPAALLPGSKPWCSLLSRVARQVPSSVPSFVFFVRPSQGSLVSTANKTGDHPQTTSASQRSLFSPTRCLVSAKRQKLGFCTEGQALSPIFFWSPPLLPHQQLPVPQLQLPALRRIAVLQPPSSSFRLIRSLSVGRVWALLWK